MQLEYGTITRFERRGRACRGKVDKAKGLFERARPTLKPTPKTVADLLELGVAAVARQRTQAVQRVKATGRGHAATRLSLPSIEYVMIRPAPQEGRI
jgi:hypothetical protein